MNKSLNAVFAATLLLTGCCPWRTARFSPILDHVEVFVFAGYGKVEDCNCPLPTQLPLETQRGDVVNLWVRAVHKDSLQSPIKSVEVDFVLTDADGKEVSGAPHGHITTNSKGFAKIPPFVPPGLGVWRMLLRYRDHDFQAYSLAGPIIVAS